MTDATQPSPSEPRTFERVPFPYADISTHDNLIAWSRAYAKAAADTHDVAVDFSCVDWRVSTRAKRRAAAVKQARIPDAEVGIPLDWEAAIEKYGPAYATEHDCNPEDVRRCTVVLTWAAVQAFDRAEWAQTLRHELVHVEQFQRYGRTNHRGSFKNRAAELDAPVHCRAFTPAKYRLVCRECETVVARRYQDCALVRNVSDHRSRCCGANLDCKERA